MRRIILNLFLFAVVWTPTFAQEAVMKQVDELLLDAKLTEAIEKIDQQLNIQKEFRTSVTLANKKAEAFTRMGKFAEADNTLREIETQLTQTPDPFLEAITNSNKGFLELNRGRNDLAEQLLQKALRTFEQAGRQGSLESAQALSYLGSVYLNTGRYTQAEEQVQMALSLRKNQLEESHELIAAAYNDLGLIYSQLNKDKALDHYEAALAMYKKLHGEEHAKIAIVNINMGIVYREVELYGDAVNNFETALKIWDKVYPQPHQAKAIALYNLGQTYLNMGDQKATMAFYEKALSMYESTYGKKHPEIANVLNAMGDLLLSQYSYDAALSSYQKALIANVPDFDNSNPSANPSLNNYYHGVRLLQSLLLKAQGFETRYLGKTLKFNDLDQALTVLQLCDTLIDKLRQESTNESDKILLGVVAHDVYAAGVRIAYEAGLNALKKSPYYKKAFYFAEKSKSAVLLEAIADSNAKSFAGIPAPLLNEEHDLRSAIALCAQKLAQRPSADEEKQLRETAFGLNRSYNDFIRRLEKEYPEYFNLKYDQSLPSVMDLQAALDKQTLLLSYFLDEKDQRLYVFQITPTRFSVDNIALPADFDKKITGLRNSLYYNAAPVYKSVAYELYKILIPGNITSEKLVVLPTARLSIIPFEALLTKRAGDTQNDFKALPYLVKETSVQYEFSASLLMQKLKSKTSNAQPSILLCAPVSFPQESGLPELPGTEAEVNEIARLFKSKSLVNKLYCNTDASEKAFKSIDLMQYTFLHFATHGVVDEEHPELSRIFLRSDTQAEDGNLFTGEIYNLQLDAQLVTLSACQTGLGKISKGEGVIGLSRALVYAGARNIVVSFWSVADESTSELMQEFYKRLLDKPSDAYAKSLRHAKLQLIGSDNHSSPYYWAPFILIGY